MDERLPFYDKKGRVNDPDIARKAAETEGGSHKKRFGIFPPSKKEVKKGERDAEVFLEHEKIASELAEKRMQDGESRKHREFVFAATLKKALEHLSHIKDDPDYLNANHDLLELTREKIEKSGDLSEHLAANIPNPAYREGIDRFAEAADDLLDVIRFLKKLHQMTAAHADRAAALEGVRAGIKNFRTAAEALSVMFDHRP